MSYDRKSIEQKTLEFWRRNKTFQKSIEQRKKARDFVFYEGPPTANGKPGIHHVLTRAFKDLMCRYKTMRGFKVVRKAGWDTHGLPVELEVEKKQGFKTKQDIEKFGVGRFNALCKKSVFEYKQDWEKLTERIGFWLDMENPYITNDPLYMETLFWVIRQIWDQGLLYEGHKVVPWCPRCGTGLSSHEVALGYKDVTENSVFVKFPISNFQFSNKFQIPNSKFPIYILAWTTTPWTLPGNVALAVGADITHVAVQQGDETLILAKERLPVLVGEYEVLKEFSGKELKGIEYEPLFDSMGDIKEKKHYVAPADFVSTEEGTGVVHTAVMYGEDDYALGEKLGLPKVHTVNPDGTFNERVPQWQGRFVKDVEKEIVRDLTDRNLLYKAESYTHSYPFCWRCGTALLYYARRSWYVAMSKLRNALIANNEKINWVPAHLKEGRFGEWLKEVKDWAFSRERYWGTPLPLWRCVKGHVEVIGSRVELAQQKFTENHYTVMRHGYSNSNHEKYLSCSPEAPRSISHLTKKGVAQVKKTAQTIKRKKIDVIIASDVTRTRETAEIVGEVLGIKPIFDARIREVNGGIFNGRPLAEYHAFFKDQEERFTKRPEAGETFNEVKKRMVEFIKDIDSRHHEKNILIVSHEVPISMLESAMRGLTIQESIDWRSKNAVETGESRDLPFAPFPHNDDGEVDFHKPFIDEVEFECKKCAGTMRRVSDVVDVWFDSGAMPFAQGRWPFAQNQKSKIKNQKVTKPELFPADYICEAIDQTRGWFYTLLAISTLLKFGPPYLNVISTGHVLDEKGEKMSKSKGNAVDPWTVLEKFGADAVRWYFFTVNAPGEPKLFAQKDVEAAQRRMIGILWNSLEFLKMYQDKKSEIRNPKPSTRAELGAGPVPHRNEVSSAWSETNSKFQILNSKHVLDRWVVARLHQLIQEVTKRLDEYDITTAARETEKFAVEDLSQWYIRRSRRRFQKPESSKEKDEAAQTLRYVLVEFSKLCAPFLPFISEEIFQRIKNHELRIKGFESVHLADWPKAIEKLVDANLIREMELARKVVSLGLKARAKAGIKVRQPLGDFRFQTQHQSKARCWTSPAPKRSFWCGVSDFRLTDDVAQLIKEELSVKEVEMVLGLPTDKKWVLETEGDVAVALDIEITAELKEEGIAREIVRNIQDMRKEAEYKPQDKIYVYMEGERELRALLPKWEKFLERETLVREIHERAQGKGALDREREIVIDGQKLWIGIRKI